MRLLGTVVVRPLESGARAFLLGVHAGIYMSGLVFLYVDMYCNMYMCIYIYIYVYVYMCIYIGSDVHLYVLHVCVSVHESMQVVCLCALFSGSRCLRSVRALVLPAARGSSASGCLARGCVLAVRVCVRCLCGCLFPRVLGLLASSTAALLLLPAVADVVVLYVLCLLLALAVFGGLSGCCAAEAGGLGEFAEQILVVGVAFRSFVDFCPDCLESFVFVLAGGEVALVEYCQRPFGVLVVDQAGGVNFFQCDYAHAGCPTEGMPGP